MRYESLGRQLPRTFEDPPKPDFTIELRQKDVTLPYTNRLQAAYEVLTHLMFKLDTSPVDVKKLSDSLELAYRNLRGALPKNHSTPNMPFDYIYHFNRLINVYNQIAPQNNSDGFHFVLPNHGNVNYIHVPMAASLDEIMREVARLAYPIGSELPALCLQIENHTDVESIYLGITGQRYPDNELFHEYSPTVSYSGIGFKQIHKGSPQHIVTPNVINIIARDNSMTS